MRVIKLGTIICLLLAFLIGKADHIPFDHITINHGLSQSSINTIIQDSNGFMWFGTKNGLNRYDGHDFSSYWHVPGDTTTLNNSYITKIVIGPQERLWIGSHAGLNIFNQHNNEMIEVLLAGESKHLLSNIAIHDIAFSGEDVWIATEHGVYKLKQTDLPNTYSHQVFFSKQFVNSLLPLEDGMIAVSNTGKLIKFDPNTGNIIKMVKTHTGTGQTTVQSFNEDLMWVSGTTGFMMFQKSDLEVVHLEELATLEMILRNSPVSQFIRDQEGNIWIGCVNGLFKLNWTDGTILHANHDAESKQSISYNLISEMYCSTDGTVWIGTDGMGLNLWHPSYQKFNAITSFKSDRTRSLASVRSILVENDTMCWLGGYTGLIYLNSKTEKYVSVPDFYGKNVYYIEQDLEDTNTLWIGTEGSGLFKFNKKTFKYKNYTVESTNGALISNRLTRVLDYGDGQLWLGTNNGLFIFNKGDESITKVPSILKSINGIRGSFIRCITKDSDGNLWIGTQKGGLNLFNHRTKQFKHFYANDHNPESLSNNFVFSVFEDSNHVIWIGTIGGLNRFNREEASFSSFNTSNALIDDDIYGIQEDSKDNLWLSCDKGLMVFSTKLTKMINRYDAMDGLQGNEFNAVANAKGKDGKMYFGGIKGVNIFKPSDIVFNEFLPSVVLTDLKIFNEPVGIGQDILGDVVLAHPIEDTDELTFSHLHQVITFEFSALSFMLSQENKYAYTLKGFEEKWNYVGNKNTATYTNLPPGHYSLMIKACNQDDMWSNEPLSIKVHVLPPWYRTKLFYILAILCFAATIYSIIKIREKSLIKQRNILEEKVKERTVEIEMQKTEISEQHSELNKMTEKLQVHNTRMTDSLTYAKHIQQSILPSERRMILSLRDHFVMYEPRDIVSGDFYWCFENRDYLFLSVADCTGHGVPGAFMSILGSAILDKVVIQQKVYEPEKALNRISAEMKIQMDHTQDQDFVDGMDLSLIRIDKKDLTLHFSGACSTIFIMQQNELLEMFGDELPIGYVRNADNYSVQTVQLQPDDIIYMFSDGYADQRGGEKKKKFYQANFKTLIQEISGMTMRSQELELKRRFTDWKGDNMQIDDVCVLGLKARDFKE